MAKKVELTEEEKIDEQIVELIVKKTGHRPSAQEVGSIINKMYGKVIQKLLDVEFDEFMGYKKNSHEEKASSNRRNGKTTKGKVVKTEYGSIVVAPPRDREGEFEPELIKKRQRVLEGFETKVIAMYSRGFSLADISKTIQEVYSLELSEETLSNMTKAVSEEIETWQNRPLQSCYPFVYIDCLYAKVKDDLRSTKKAIYVALGINCMGIKDVLGIWVDNTESTSKWCEILDELKARGVKDIFFVSLDGLTGLADKIEDTFPNTVTQRCIVHIDRNIYNILPKKDCKEVMADFKQIYNANNLHYAKEAYRNFSEKYKENTKLMKKVDENIEYIYQLFEYPVEIRKMIYTTNAIESLNAALRKVTRGKGSFINEPALMKVLYLRVKDLQKTWAQGVKEWKSIQRALINTFGERYLQYCEDDK